MHEKFIKYKAFCGCLTFVSFYKLHERYFVNIMMTQETRRLLWIRKVWQGEKGIGH